MFHWSWKSRSLEINPRAVPVWTDHGQRHWNITFWCIYHFSDTTIVRWLGFSRCQTLDIVLPQAIACEKSLEKRTLYRLTSLSALCFNADAPGERLAMKRSPMANKRVETPKHYRAGSRADISPIELPGQKIYQPSSSRDVIPRQKMVSPEQQNLYCLRNRSTFTRKGVIALLALA